MNEQGHLNLGRCERFIKELAENEKTAFDNEKKAELMAKQRRQRKGRASQKTRGSLSFSTPDYFIF